MSTPKERRPQASGARAVWSLEPGPIETRACACCTEQLQLATGAIRDEKGEAFAFYAAILADHAGPREVRLFVAFKDTKRPEPGHVVVSLVLRRDQGNIVAAPVTDNNNPLGRALTRKQALTGRFRSLILEIGDFIGKNDPHVRPFLEAGGTTSGQDAK
jgi:hypothetical protein